MSKSWRVAPEAPLLRKPQYVPEMEPDLNPEEIFIVVSEWPAGEDIYLTEDVSIKRTHASAWLVLQGIAEGQGIDLPHNDTSFTNGSDETWYITTGVLED